MSMYRGRGDFPRGGGRRPPPHPYRHPHDDRNGRYSSDRYERRSSPPRRQDPSHDRSRTPPRMASGGHEYSDRRGWEYEGRDDNDDYYGRDSDRFHREHSPQRRQPRERYRDRDREGYRSSSDDRSRSRSPRRSKSPYYGGAPSRDVIMDGLPLEMNEEDISKELKQFHKAEDLDDVRVIRDHQTKQSRGFGFLRFRSIESATAFLEENYPTLSLYEGDLADGNERAAKVRVAFSKERDDRGRPAKPDAEWQCSLCSFKNFSTRRACFKCHTPYFDSPGSGNVTLVKQPEFLNSGDSDASPDGSPSQFLLVRSLEPSVTEELLAKGVAKLYKPNSQNTQAQQSVSKKGNAKVASTTGDANLGAKEGSIRRVLLVRDRQTNESWRYGFAEFSSLEEAQAALTRFNSFDKFTISSKPVYVSYIHAGVFTPVFNLVEGYELVSFAASNNPAQRLQYWDQNAYVSELVVAEPADDQSAKDVAQQHKAAVDAAAAAAANAGLVAVGEEAEAKSKKRRAEPKESDKSKKSAPAHLQFWSNRHAELHGGKARKAQQPDGNAEDSTEPTAPPSISPSKPTEHSYADPSKNCCYLCARQFKTAVEVHKHERLSQLHRDNLQSDDARTKATAKMAKAGLKPQPVATADDAASPEYRDRAKERRKAFGASKISLPLKKQPSAGAADASTAASASASAAPSKGAALLGKMGWTTGAGLGAQGTGSTAPLATEMYAEGVGLGAQGGKVGDAAAEADRNTRSSYSEFVERARDKAKERFESMG